MEQNKKRDIASGRIAEACKGMISAEPMHASQQECWGILEMNRRGCFPSYCHLFIRKFSFLKQQCSLLQQR